MGLSSKWAVWKIMIMIFLFITIAIGLAFYFRLIFITFLIGAFLLIVVEEIKRNYKKQFSEKNYPSWKRKIYGIAIIIFWSFAIIFLFYLSVGQLTETFFEITSDKNMTISERLADSAKPYIPDGIENRFDVNEIVSRGAGFIVTILAQLIGGITSFVLASFIIVPLIFYLYYRKWDKIVTGTKSIFPDKYNASFIRAGHDIKIQLYEFFRGKIVQSIIMSGIFCLGFYIGGVKGWLLLGVLAGILNIIPYLGPIIGAIPPLIVTFLVDEPIVSVFVLITVVVAQVIDNFYLQPFLLAGKLKIDPLLSIVLVLVGAQLYGALGMILALPIFAVYKIILSESYETLIQIYDMKPRLRKKGKRHG